MSSDWGHPTVLTGSCVSLCHRSPVDDQGNALSVQVFVATHLYVSFNLPAKCFLPSPSPLFHLSLPTFSNSDYDHTAFGPAPEATSLTVCNPDDTTTPPPRGTLTSLSYSAGTNWVFSPLRRAERKEEPEKKNIII